MFVPGCLLVLAAGYLELGVAEAALLAAVVLVGVGECLHTTALMPLVADLAPLALRGRYMAATGFSWWLGLALAPTLGTQLLSVSAPATMVGRQPSRWSPRSPPSRSSATSRTPRA